VQSASATRPTPVWYLPGLHHVQLPLSVRPAPCLRHFCYHEKALNERDPYEYCNLVLELHVTPGDSGSAFLTMPAALASHAVCGLYPAGEQARQSYAHLIQTGTCQRHTVCSWPQKLDPPRSGTCQAHTMSNFHYLSHSRVNLVRLSEKLANFNQHSKHDLTS
jgi:hypothetical protein